MGIREKLEFYMDLIGSPVIALNLHFVVYLEVASVGKKRKMVVVTDIP